MSVQNASALALTLLHCHGMTRFSDAYDFSNMEAIKQLALRCHEQSFRFPLCSMLPLLSLPPVASPARVRGPLLAMRHEPHHRKNIANHKSIKKKKDASWKSESLAPRNDRGPFNEFVSTSISNSKINNMICKYDYLPTNGFMM